MNNGYQFEVNTNSHNLTLPLIANIFSGKSSSQMTENVYVISSQSNGIDGQLNTDYNNPSSNGAYLDIILGGLVILLGVLGYLCLQSTEKARYEALHN